MFSMRTYQERRRRLAQCAGHGLLLFLGNAESGMNYADNAYPFRQDSTFLYFFGLDIPRLAAVMDLDSGAEVLFGDDITLTDIVWTGPMPLLAEQAARSGLQAVQPLKQLGACVQRALQSGRTVHYLPPYRPEHVLWLGSLLHLNPSEQADRVSETFVRAVVDLRNHKTPEEVEAIEEAVDVSVEMHLAAFRLARPGVTEAELAAAVAEVPARRGYLLSFPTIATVQGHILHNHGYSHMLRAGDMFLLDAGSENAAHYAGDLSSTMPVSEEFSSRQADIYAVQLASFQAAVGALAPGVPFVEAHLAAATAICDGLKQLGLMKGDPAEAAREGAAALFFPHGVGHMLGLDVHDMENLGETIVGYAPGEKRSDLFGFRSLRLARRMEEGFVFTIEPGIYFIPALMDQWQAEGRFADFICYDRLAPWRCFTGMRNEMNYLMTASGPRQLGHLRKPMTPGEVQAARSGSYGIAL